MASRAIRQALTETDRVAAERRAQIGVRYQIWENGKAGDSVCPFCCVWGFSGRCGMVWVGWENKGGMWRGGRGMLGQICM